MTLIELMAVIAVIAVLAGIMAFFVTGNKESKAQVALANDISTLLQEQRTRAASMNVATYVQFHPKYVEPRIGGFSACMLSDELQYPVQYDTAKTTHMAIDIADGHRALDSISSTKYVDTDGTGYTTMQVVTFKRGETNGYDPKTSDTQPFTICFQPNGQAYVMHTKGTFIDDVVKTRISIGINGITGYLYNVEVTGLGMVHITQQKSANVLNVEPDD